MRKMLLLQAGLLAVIGVVMVVKLLEGTATSEVVIVPVIETPVPIPVTSTSESVPTLTPYELPTEVVLTNDYVFGQAIDLSSGQPMSLAILLSDENWLVSNWAGAVSYRAEDDPEQVFLPEKGIVYSYLGDVTTTWAHSGIGIYGQRYFATNLDLFIRKDTESQTVSLSVAEEKAKSLVGKTAYLCQAENGEITPLTSYDASAGCPGRQLTLEVAAAVVVPHEDLAEYDEAILDINEWLIEKYPGAGFEKLSQKNGWIVRFCIGRLVDQKSDGSAGYLYNRGVIGFVIRK